MALASAGLLMYRRSGGRLEVLLVHPGGPFFRTRDLGSWTIPKGLLEAGEEPLAAARREFQEETSCMPPAGAYLPLGSVRQKGGKVVHGFACAGDFDPARLVSGHFELEWPPKSGRRASFPEVDRAAWFDLDAARQRILPAQEPFLDRLAAALAGESAAEGHGSG